MKTGTARTLLCVVVLGAGFATLPAGAVTVSLLPATADVTPGQTISIDLVISGLAFQGSPSLGDFDIDLDFDPSALTFVGYTLSDGLGAIGTFDAIDVSFGLYAAGVINLAEVSLLPAADLDANQPDAFVLATLDFMVAALAVGSTTTIAVDHVYSLGDGVGDALALDATHDAVLTGAAVPLPAACWLLAGALGLLGVHGRDRG